MLTPQEVSERAFSKASFGGYNMAMVDEFLDQLTEDYTVLYKENAALKSKLKVLATKVEEYRGTEDAMRRTLITAQQTADQILSAAEEKRNQIETEAAAEVRAAVAKHQQEIDVEKARLVAAENATATYVARLRELHLQETTFLNNLNNLVPTAIQAQPNPSLAAPAMTPPPPEGLGAPATSPGGAPPSESKGEGLPQMPSQAPSSNGETEKDNPPLRGAREAEEPRGAREAPAPEAPAQTAGAPLGTPSPVGAPMTPSSPGAPLGTPSPVGAPMTPPSPGAPLGQIPSAPSKTPSYMGAVEEALAAFSSSPPPMPVDDSPTLEVPRITTPPAMQGNPEPYTPPPASPTASFLGATPPPASINDALRMTTNGTLKPQPVQVKTGEFQTPTPVQPIQGQGQPLGYTPPQPDISATQVMPNTAQSGGLYDDLVGNFGTHNRKPIDPNNPASQDGDYPIR